MFIEGGKNSKIILDFLQSDQEKFLGVAFIGSGLSKIIQGKTKIICNLASGSTNPDEIVRLMKHPNVEVKNNSTLHAKVYLYDNVLIVGSANISTNGIAIENESAHWIEASIISNNANEISAARMWLNDLWDNITSESITPIMIQNARNLYAKRRSGLPITSDNLNNLLDKNIYCIIYKEDQLSTDANILAEEHLGAGWDERGYGAYEKWGSRIPNGLLIDYHYKNGKLRQQGVWSNEGYSAKSTETDIQIVKKANVRLGKLTRKSILDVLQGHLKDLWPNYKNDDATIIHINKVINLSHNFELDD